MITTRPGDPPNGRRHLPTPVVVAVLCELFALALSVAANLAAVWNDGDLAIWAAGAIPFLLIGATYLFLGDRVPVAWAVPIPARSARPASWWRPARAGRGHRPGAPGWAAWWANLFAATIILVPVASASYWHQRELLLATGAPTWIATLLPLAVDGLALRAALTLFRLAHQPAASGATDHASPDTDSGEDTEDDPDEPVDGTPPTLPTLDGIPDEVVARAAALIAANPTIGRPNLKRALGVEDSPARRLLRELRPIGPVASGEGGEAA